MREEIRDILVASVPLVNGEVWEPSSAGPEMKKPSLILREGPQETSEPYAAFTSLYEVWPYVKRTTFTQVDAVSEQVIEALHQKRFDVDGVPHYVEYVGTASQDIVDEEWDALTRGLRFQVYSLAWLMHAPIEPDPVTALQTWALENFPKLQTDPMLWLPSDLQPALYWRVEATTKVEPMNWGAWLTVQLNGHVIAPDVSIRRQVVDQVTRKLAIDQNTRMTDKSKMRFLSVIADDGYDPFRQGQIKISAQFGVLREPEIQPFLKHAYFDIERGGSVHEE